MSMVLTLATVSDATIARLHRHPPLVWQIIAPDDAAFLAAAAAPQPGLLARLFGRVLPPPAPAPPLVLGAHEGATTELDKAWHGVHYLLTSTAWEGEPPLNLLVTGGREVGKEDVGYGPARTLSAAETRALATALAAVTDEALRARFAPAEMMRLEIYPEIWDSDPAEDDTLDYLMEGVAQLRVGVNTAAEHDLGLLVTIT